jgi:hypothetical protein
MDPKAANEGGAAARIDFGQRGIDGEANEAAMAEGIDHGKLTSQHDIKHQSIEFIGDVAYGQSWWCRPGS